MVMPRLFRHDIGRELRGPLRDFAQANSGTSPQEYARAWAAWRERHEQAIADETQRLRLAGFVGDVADKLAKAARYYFARPPRLRPTRQPETRAARVFTTREFQSAARAHCLGAEDAARPTSLYDDFCLTHRALLCREVGSLVQAGLPAHDITVRLRKAYKNCYDRVKRGA